MELRGDQHESAVKEQRVWIRLNRLCNNRCIFCLDSDSHDGSMVSFEEVAEQIRRGRERGGERLILSGGEATLHPRYIDFLRLGKDVGYTWLQTISNGRMFAYPAFAQKALAAGLQEVTLSIHGHNDALHDKLVGVPGAFKHTMAGLKNLLGRCIVSVDVVLNKQNIPHLHDILKFFIGLGVSEFDLLHMVPFGRAWSEHRDELFYDAQAVMPHLKRAFALRRKHPIVLWTNRLPAAFLEGEEDLIQDPHKLHDEVRGRMEMLQAFADEGVVPCCQGERCDFCPMQGYCGHLQPLTPSNRQAQRNSIRVGAQQEAVAQKLLREGILATTGTLLVRVHEETTEQQVLWAVQFSRQGLDVWLECDKIPEWPIPEGLHARVRTLVETGVPAIRQFLQGTADTVRWLPMERRMVAMARDGGVDFSSTAVGVWYVGRDYLSDSRQVDASAEEIKELVARFGAIHGMADCLGGVPLPVPGMDMTHFDAGGRLDLVRFTDWYIREAYYVKSLRCGACPRAGRCRGLHINYVRNVGFGVLTPMSGA